MIQGEKKQEAIQEQTTDGTADGRPLAIPGTADARPLATIGTAGSRPLATPGFASSSEEDHRQRAELVDRKLVRETLKSAFGQFGARDAKFCFMEQQIHAERMAEKTMLRNVASELAPLGFPEDVLMKEYASARGSTQKRLKLYWTTQEWWRYITPDRGMGEPVEEEGARAGGEEEGRERLIQNSAAVGAPAFLLDPPKLQ